MEENKSKNKKIIAIVIVVVVLLVGAIAVLGGSVISERAQLEVLNKEISKINQTGTVDSEVKATGKYGEVEKALKDYVLECQAITKEAVNQYQNESFSTILSADNLKNDGPEFTASKKLIADTKAKGEETKTKLAEMISDEYKEKKANESGLTGKYKDFFIENIQLEKDLKSLNTTIDNVNNYLTKVNEIFDFLVANKGNWEVSSNKVQFTKGELVTKYNSLINSANSAARMLTLTR